MTDQDRDDEFTPVSPLFGDKIFSRSRIITASAVMVLWVLILFNTWIVPNPLPEDISVPLLVFWFFAPSIAVGILLHNWVFKRKMKFRILRGLMITVFLLVLNLALLYAMFMWALSMSPYVNHN